MGISLRVYVNSALRSRPIHLFLNGGPAWGVWQFWQADAQSSRPWLACAVVYTPSAVDRGMVCAAASAAMLISGRARRSRTKGTDEGLRVAKRS